MTPHTQTTGGRYLGHRIARREDARFLTGRGRFVDDIAVPGTLHAAFARSDVARGRIVSVDIEAARALPGVVAVYTASDLNHLVLDQWTDQELLHPPIRPYRLLADGDVRFVGEPIAVVVAESRYIAEDAVDEIVIDIEQLPALVDYQRALDPDAVIVHPELGSNVSREMPDAPNPALDEIFATAPVVLTETFRQHRYLCAPMETRGILASWDKVSDELTLWLSTQGPQGARSWLARLLDHDESRIRVIMPDVGGSFGLKMFSSAEEIAAVLATRQIGRPVKWIEDRRENLIAGQHCREDQVTLTMAVDGEGRFLGVKAQFLESAGAFPAPASSATAFAAILLPGPYRLSNYAASGHTVFTNTAGRGGYRGPWMIETVVREQMIDCVAVRLGIDPLEIRRRNVIQIAELPYTMVTGFVYDQMTAVENLEQAAEIVGYEALREQQRAWRSEGRLVGIGISLLAEPSAMAFGPMSTEAATVRVQPSGAVDVQTSTLSNGQGIETTLAQVVAEELGVDIDRVRVLQGDTDTAPNGGGSGGSRSAVIAGGAAREAAQEVRQRIVSIAAHMLEANPEDIEITDGRAHVVGTPSRHVTVAEVARKAYYEPASLPPGQPRGLEAHTRYAPDNFCTWSNACHICVCEVDRDTGAVTILRYVVSEDCGVMINPNVVEGQIAGGVVQGLGGVLYEHLQYDPAGNPMTSTFLDYLLPTAAEVPVIEYGHIETRSPTNAGGHKGMGEGGAIASPPAIINAVADALAPLGVQVRSQPLTPGAILDLIDAASPEAVP